MSDLPELEREMNMVLERVGWGQFCSCASQRGLPPPPHPTTTTTTASRHPPGLVRAYGRELACELLSGSSLQVRSHHGGWRVEAPQSGLQVEGLRDEVRDAEAGVQG